MNDLSTTTFIQLLPFELKEISKDQFIEPDSKLQRSDIEVGIMSDVLRRIYTLWQLKEKAADECRIEYKYATSDDKRKEVMGRGTQYAFKAAALQHIFWIGVNDEFNLWDVAEAGVREGWKVVKLGKRRQTFMDIFKEILDDPE